MYVQIHIICVYIYIYIYTHIFIYIYTYILVDEEVQAMREHLEHDLHGVEAHEAHLDVLQGRLLEVVLSSMSPDALEVGVGGIPDDDRVEGYRL